MPTVKEIKAAAEAEVEKIVNEAMNQIVSILENFDNEERGSILMRLNFKYCDCGEVKVGGYCPACE